MELNNIYNIDCLNGIEQMDYCDLLITDIPYNISQKPHSKGYRELDYGEWDKQDDKEIYKRVYLASEKTRNACYIFCADQQFSTIYNHFKDLNKKWVVRTLVSLKSNPTVINCDKLYAPSQDLIVYAKRRCGLYNPRYKKSYFTYPVPTGKKRFHPSQKPLGLIKEFIEDSSSEGQVICDIFAGSGTTLIGAKELGRNYIGFENTEKYYDIAVARLNN